MKMPMMPAPRRPKAARPPKPKLNAVVRASMSKAARAEDFEDEEDYEYEPNMKLSHAFMVVLVLHVVALGGVFAFNSLQANKAKRNEAMAITASESKTSKTSEASEKETVVTEKKAPVAIAEKKAPATLPAASASTKTAVASNIHEVAAGETLKQIAAMNKVSVEALEKENGLSTYSVIKPGQRLKIPSASKTAETSVTATKAAAPTAASTEKKANPTMTATEAPAKPAGNAEYTVAKGDNPYTIAKRFKVSYAALLKANNITDPTKLQIGQKLVIPKTASN